MSQLFLYDTNITYLIPLCLILSRKRRCRMSFCNNVLSSYSNIINPSEQMTSITCLTYWAQSSFVSASTITRITGSVPLSRTRIRPLSPSSSVTCAIAATTAGFSYVLKKLWINGHFFCKFCKRLFLFKHNFHNKK